MKFKLVIGFILCSLVLSINQTHGQNSKRLDSLLKIHHAVNDTQFVKSCCAISNEYINNKKIGLSFNYSDSALNRAKAIKNLRLEAYVYNHIGNLYVYISDYHKAIEYFESAMKIQKVIGFNDGVGSSLLNKGNAYFYSGELQKAEKTYREAMNIYANLKADVATEINIYTNIGSVCGAQRKYKEADAWFKKALALSEKEKDYLSIAYAYNNLGSNQNSQGNYQAALPFMEKALQLKLKYGTNADISDAYSNMSSIYYASENYKQCIKWLLLSLQYLDTSVYNRDLKMVYENLATNYDNLNNIAESNKYYIKLQAINNIIFEKEMQSHIDETDVMIEFNKSHLRDSLSQVSEIHKQVLEISKRKTQQIYLLIIVAIVIIFLLLLYKRYKISQSQKKEIGIQKDLVDQKQKEILDSIKYAQRIQNSLMPTEKYIERVLKNRDKI